MDKIKRFSSPPSHINYFSIEDCQFYTVQNLPGMTHPTKGYWDLRKNVDEYLGHVIFENKTVLELGPASGFITFHIEKMKGEVTSLELSVIEDRWDIVPYCTWSWQEKEKEHRIEKLKKVQNAYWFAHEKHNSSSKVIYTHIADVSKDVGIYDISLMCSVLLHLQNPYLAIRNILSVTKEKAIITDLLPEILKCRKLLWFKFLNLISINRLSRLFSTPVLQFLPDANMKKHDFAWWMISPEVIANMASIFGFEKSKINYHTQYHLGKPIDFYTVVCERTVPIEECNYDFI